VVMVNTKFPERNREFDIVRLPQIDHNHHSRSAYHIRRSVDPCDFDKWEATIPEPSEYPDWFNQCPSLFGLLMIIKGPSRTDWIRDYDRYHANIKCSETFREHKAADLEIQEDKTREDSHYLLVWPKGTRLDNNIFSGDGNDVEIQFNDMKVEAKDSAFDKDILGIAVWWRIADYGGRKVKDAKNKVDPKLLFTK
jgi:hypothetical protein